jgi:hypothetical protein
MNLIIVRPFVAGEDIQNNKFIHNQKQKHLHYFSDKTYNFMLWRIFILQECKFCVKIEKSSRTKDHHPPQL